MKTEELKALNLDEDTIAKIMAMNGKDINAEKVKTTAMETSMNNYKGQLETAQNALKGFEGINVDELNSKIKALQGDLTAQQTKYEGQIADMKFNDIISAALTKAGAKNIKAIKSLLDIDALKTSKNQEADIKTAIENCKKENDYMFDSDEPFKNPVAGAGNKDKKDLTSVEALFLAKNPGLKID